jgi:hypothetical protein
MRTNARAVEGDGSVVKTSIASLGSVPVTPVLLERLGVEKLRPVLGPRKAAEPRPDD